MVWDNNILRYTVGLLKEAMPPGAEGFYVGNAETVINKLQAYKKQEGLSVQECSKCEQAISYAEILRGHYSGRATLSPATQENTYLRLAYFFDERLNRPEND